jgi:hypothetical protein
MIALINSARLQAGKSALGWLNPSIYRYNVLSCCHLLVGDLPFIVFAVIMVASPMISRKEIIVAPRHLAPAVNMALTVS